jgi:hypothetical protein
VYGLIGNNRGGSIHWGRARSVATKSHEQRVLFLVNIFHPFFGSIHTTLEIFTSCTTTI